MTPIFGLSGLLLCVALAMVCEYLGLSLLSALKGLGIVLLSVLVWRTLRVRDLQLSAREVEHLRRQRDLAAEERILGKEQVLAERLAGAIQFKTVSYESGSEEKTNLDELLKLQHYLAQCFPLVHQQLERHVINDYRLVRCVICLISHCRSVCSLV